MTQTCGEYMLAEEYCSQVLAFCPLTACMLMFVCLPEYRVLGLMSGLTVAMLSHVKWFQVAELLQTVTIC